ncbi:hypothetical protein HK104_001521 [Borealophlyctis nickersoniae]|nr:hypothetical protein HK104_001521 [Borealophlyctis nickersoniae]
MHSLTLLLTLALSVLVSASPIRRMACEPPTDGNNVDNQEQNIPYTCRASFLQGTFSSFDVKGGNATYAPDTRQTIVYTWAAGSNVTQIANVSLVGDLTNFVRGSNVLLQVFPDVRTALPIDFDTKTEPADLSGVIAVTLPPADQLPVGSYRFNVWVRVKRHGVCSVYSDPFEVTL